MKTTLKVFLAISLFSSIALAGDGNQGSGGRPYTPPPVLSPDDGNQGSGGRTTGDAMPVLTMAVSVVEQYLGLGF